MEICVDEVSLPPSPEAQVAPGSLLHLLGRPLTLADFPTPSLLTALEHGMAGGPPRRGTGR